MTRRLDGLAIDSDFVEGRTNMQRVVLAAVYCPTDAIIVAMRVGDAYRVNRDQLLQMDFGWKFQERP